MAGRGDLRRLISTLGLLITAGGFFALALFLRAQGLEKSTQWLSVLGGVLAIAAAAKQPIRTMVVSLRPGGARSQLVVADAAEHLAQALKTEWSEGERRRAGSSPLALPVRWTVTRKAEYAMAGVDWEDLGAGNSAVEPQQLAGEYDTIYETFTKRLPHHRLVVLGRAGGGKSFLARRLVRELLDRRAPGDPVPVFLSLASWDPKENLHAWVSRRLIRDHPGLEKLSAGPLGGPLLPLSTRLVKSDRLLFVLDGFDEIPGASGKAALEGIEYLGAQVPVVVTSRTDEYCQAIQAFGRGLPRVAAVELSSMDTPAIKSYLAKTTAVIPPGRWDAVFALLDRANGNPVTQALQVPLMIWLARIVYKDSKTKPAELADPVAFADRTAVENHLLDKLITAAYTDPGRDSEQKTACKARQWLHFLAQWLQRRGTSDLAWWQLPTSAPGTLPRLMTGIPVGLAAGVPAGIIMGVWFGFWAGLTSGLSLTALATARAFSPALHPFGHRLPGPILGRAVALATGLGIGLPTVFQGHLALGVAQGASAGILAGLAAGFVVHERRMMPTRVTIAVRGNVMRILHHIAVGLLIGLLFGVVLGVLLGLVNGPVTGLVFAILSLALGLALGIVDGLHIWIDTPTDLSRSISPRTVLGDDRAAALARALVAGPLVGVGVGLTAAFARGPAAGIGVACAMAFAFITTDRMVGMASTSWGSFTLVRTWLALCRQLPWHFMGFLDDAHERGILRRSGAVHQFRHARLQQRLAATNSDL